jgi:hypothetical protein
MLRVQGLSLFGARAKLVPWVGNINVGTRWQLVEFSARTPPSWEKFWEDQRAYWSADDYSERGRARFHHFFGPDDPESVFLRKTTDGYISLCKYMMQWNGLCCINEVVSVHHYKNHSIVLTQLEWTGTVRDNSDLRLHLKETRNIFGKRKKLECEIYNTGTIFIPKGGMEEAMGERPGTYPIDNLRNPDDQDILFDQTNNQISLNEAKFRVFH